jgi:SAM-dependent methyltransferase
MSHSSPPANPANAPSARFFGGVGITSGMRVLDVGCGNGDLSRFVAGLVGADGQVVGIDRSDPALAMARGVERAAGAASIDYHVVDLAAPLPDLGHFDAIVGRRVLMYLPDAAVTLVRLTGLARPGAMIAFQEHARSALPAGLGALPIHRQLYDLAWDTVAAEGGDVGLGLRLSPMMAAAGLSIAEARSEAILLQPEAPSFLPTLMQAMLPRMVEHGVTTEADLDIATLPDRLLQEQRASGGTIVWDLAFLVAGQR